MCCDLVMPLRCPTSCTPSAHPRAPPPPPAPTNPSGKLPHLNVSKLRFPAYSFGRKEITTWLVNAGFQATQDGPRSTLDHRKVAWLSCSADAPGLTCAYSVFMSSAMISVGRKIFTLQVWSMLGWVISLAQRNCKTEHVFAARKPRNVSVKPPASFLAF